MGISGLLPLLKSIQRPVELKKYSGETLAVDAYGWLHRGAISCAMELAQGKPTRRFVDSVMNRVRMVQHFGVTPYLVFDGDYLPSKAGTEASRARRRAESRKAGLELARAGQAKQAYAELQKAIDITPEMARQLIEELKSLGLPYVVAPYEADAQMVYLERCGLVSGILSEDSDLLVFGAKRLLTKLDMHGRCIEINRRDFCAVREISLTDFSDREFRLMAILSGCDYLDGIGNMGLKTAYRMIRKHKTVEKIVRMLQFDGKFRVSENYLAAFHQAELTFLHQRVFCPIKQELVLLSEPTDGLDVEQMLFIGHRIDHDVARAIAVGDLNPITKEPIVLPPSPGKRRQSELQSQSQSQPPLQNLQTPARRPIDAYFKPKASPASGRLPLGAMEPNCFAIDREQVAALTQNGLAPRVFPLPRPYINGGRASLPMTAPLTAPPRQRIHLTSTGSNSAGPRLRRRRTEPMINLLQLGSPAISSPSTTATAPSSLPRPQKKMRLSAEPEPKGEGPPEGAERSKYFPALAAASTVTAQKSRRTESFLMSDDSIEEAMMGLPDWDDWDAAVSAKSQSKVPVFEDATPPKSHPASFDPEQDNSIVPESPVAPKTKSAAKSTAKSRLPLSSSSASRRQSKCNARQSLSQEAQTTEARAATPANRRFSLAQFSCGGRAATAAQGTRMMHGLPTPESSFQALTATTTTTTTSGLQAAAAEAEAAVPTPPSVLEQKKTKPSKAPRVSLGDLVAEMSPPPPSLFERKQSRSFSGSASANMKAKARASDPVARVNPSFVPLPPATMSEVEALNCGQGSEDQIILDSDREEDGEEDEDNSEAQKTSSRLDLSQFLCA